MSRFWLDDSGEKVVIRHGAPFAPERKLVRMEPVLDESVEDFIRRFIVASDEQGVEVPDDFRRRFAPDFSNGEE